ncbi:unnamed protein product, partial [Trichogramma brassicae]
MTPADALPAAARDYSADPASAHIMDSAVPVVATLTRNPQDELGIGHSVAVGEAADVPLPPEQSSFTSEHSYASASQANGKRKARSNNKQPRKRGKISSSIKFVFFRKLVEAFDHLRHETEAAIKRFPKIAELAEGEMEEITKMETSKYRDDIQHRLRPARFGRTRADSAAYEPLPDLPRLVVEDKPVLRLYFGVCRRMNRDEVLRLIKPFAAPPSSTVTRPKHPPVPRDGKKKKSVTSWCHINCADLLTSLHLQGAGLSALLDVGEYCGVVPQCFAAPPVGARHAGPLSRCQPLRRAAQRGDSQIVSERRTEHTRACLAAPIARQCRAENKY